MNFIEKISQLDEAKRIKLIEKIRSDGDAYGIYPLTESQMIFWKKFVLKQSTLLIGNLRFIVEMRSVSYEDVEKVINGLRDLHDVCRYRYVEIDENVFQYIDNEKKPYIAQYSADQKNPEALYRWETDFFEKPFDLAEDFPVLFAIVRISDDEFHLMIKMHHIIADGFSVGVVNRDIYSILSGNAVKSRIQFENYVPVINKLGTADTQYWIKEIRDTDKQLGLTLDYDRFTSDRDDKEDYCCVDLDSEDFKKMKSFIRNSRHNFFNITSSLFSIILQKWAAKDKIIMASTFFNRSDEKSFDIIGNFSSFLPLVYRSKGDMTLDEYIQANTEKFKEAMEHGNIVSLNLQEAYPFDCCLMTLPMYQVIFAYHSKNLYSGFNDAAPDVKLKLRDYNYSAVLKHSITDIVVRIDEMDDKYSILIGYNNRLFEKNTIQNIADIFKQLLKNADKLCNLRLNDIVLAENSRSILPDILTGSIPEAYEECDITPDDRFCVRCADNTMLCILDRSENPLPVNFVGDIYVGENSQWFKTGKAGKIDFEGRLLIDDCRSELICSADKKINKNNLITQLKTRYEDIQVRCEMFSDSILAVDYGNTDACLTAEDIANMTGVKPDLVFRSMRINQSSHRRHLKNIAGAAAVLNKNNFSYYVYQIPDSENVIIYIAGDVRPDESLIKNIYDDFPDDKIRFIFDTTGTFDIHSSDNSSETYEYQQPGLTEMQKKISDIWSGILSNNAFGIFDDFYETGTGKIYDFINEINKTFGIGLDIMTLFRYHNISELARFIGES